MSTKDLLAGARWRKSSFSGGGANGGGGCVEAAHLPNGQIALRDSKSPLSGTLLLHAAELNTLLHHIKSDHLH
jgi:hypothetical protein